MERPRLIERRSATTLTPKLQRQFCKLIIKGLPADGVCDYLSISAVAYWNWIRKGEKFIEAGEEDVKQFPEYQAYGQFVLAFRAATAKYRLNLVKKLHTVNAPGAWIREMAILERRDKKTFSRAAPDASSQQAFNPDERFV